jgi:hypothetical protein
MEDAMSDHTNFSPRVLMGGSGKPEGEEAYCCKTCGALVAECDLDRHATWHRKIDEDEE